MKTRLGWPMATLAILTFSLGQTAATAAQSLTPSGAPATATPASAVADASSLECGQAPTSPVPTFFKDEVGQPTVALPDSKNHYTLQANLNKDAHSFSPGNGWPAVTTLGYSTLNANGTVNAKMDYLGPTIVTQKGTPIKVTINNALPKAGTSMFPSWVDMPTENTTVLHRHGGLQAAVDDGTPDQKIAPLGGTRTNYYPNDQAAAPLWYHDHADGVTSWNVYAGLAGFMPNVDKIAPLYNMPTGDFAKAYVLQDKSFNADKTLCYSHAAPEFFGDLPVINGTIAPKQTVQPRRYTFTFINGSDSRFYNMSLKPEVQPAAGTSVTAPQMTVVGSDSGYVLNPAKVNTLLIAPGERYTVIVDFTGTKGSWVLSNDAKTPYPDGDVSVATVPQLMRFDVGAKVTSVDRSSVPKIIVETNNIVPAQVSLLTARLRTVQAGEMTSGMPQLGSSTALMTWATTATNPVTEKPYLNSTEAWAMRNHSPDAHPIHEHLTELRLVGRWPVTSWSEQDSNTGNAVPLTVGKFEAPGAWESGPKDTFIAPKDYITVWVGKYTIAGLSVWHCHILSHEDMMAMGDAGTMIDGMMRPLEVQTTKPQTQLPWIGTQARLDTLVRQQAAK